jgi:hypothetical protein
MNNRPDTINPEMAADAAKAFRASEKGVDARDPEIIKMKPP